MQRVAVALARENVERAADGVAWWAETIEQSREHALKVSGELPGAVRESIKLIGNDVFNRYREQGVDSTEIDGKELAKQSLRFSTASSSCSLPRPPPNWRSCPPAPRRTTRATVCPACAS